MLWAFFDESGQHGPDGRLLKLTVGGCIARFEEWECMSLAWSMALDKMAIPMFHMKDFEARRRCFDKWTHQQRTDRLNILLDIIASFKPACWGFTNLARENDNTASIYERCVHDLLVEFGMYDEEFSVVAAEHPEYRRHSQLHQLLLKYGMSTQIKSIKRANPIDTCPLQAADVIAYEISHGERLDGRPMRYPLKRLGELGCPFRFASAVE
jgi:hypothetical protein